MKTTRQRGARGAKKPARKAVAALKPSAGGLFSKDAFIKSCLFEIRIIKHLHGKIPESQFEYRPTPVQRTMTELLRYLTCCASSPLCNMRDGNWDAAESMDASAEKIDVRKDFIAAMDRQGEFIKATVGAMKDGDFESVERAMPWGAPCKLGEGLVNTVLKPLVAYRMQLFLYIKASGRHDIGPAQCWIGVDPRPQAAESR